MNINNVLLLVIFFNPSIDEIERVKKYAKFAKNILIIDNSTHSCDAIRNIANITYMHFSQNIGLSRAYNKAITFCEQNNFDFMLIMDQDSELTEQNFLQIPNEINYHNINLLHCAVIALTPCHGQELLKKQSSEVIYDNVEISSGSILNINLATKVGTFDERFFIDNVDLEYCLRVINLGYHIIRLKSIVFKHSIGFPIKITVAGKKLSSYNHSSFRRYYLTRNVLLVKEIFKDSEHPYIKAYINHLCYVWLEEQPGLINYEKDRLLKYYYCLLGWYHYTTNTFGKLDTEFFINKTQDIAYILETYPQFRQFFYENLERIEEWVHYTITQLNDAAIHNSNYFTNKSKIVKKIILIFRKILWKR